MHGAHMRSVAEEHRAAALGDPRRDSRVLVHAELEAALARLRHRHDLLRDTRTAQPTDAVLAHVARVPVGVLRGGVRAGGRVREDDRDLG